MLRNLISVLVVLLVSVFVSCSAPVSEKNKEGVAKRDSQEYLAKNYFTDCKHLYAEARRMDSILLTQTEVNKSSATTAIKAFTDFAFYCQTDSLSPVFLIKTAQVARAINNIPQAKLVLDRCIETYPSFSNRPAAMFLLAQLYDEDSYLNNEYEAEKIYKQIIDEYPKSDWALSAKGAIQFLGKSDEEIVKEFKKKKK